MDEELENTANKTKCEVGHVHKKIKKNTFQKKDEPTEELYSDTMDRKRRKVMAEKNINTEENRSFLEEMDSLIDMDSEEDPSETASLCETVTTILKEKCNDIFVDTNTDDQPGVDHCKEQSIEFIKTAVSSSESCKLDRTSILLKKPFLNHWTCYRPKTSSISKQWDNSPLKRSFTAPARPIDAERSNNVIDFWKSTDNGVKCSLPLEKYGKSDSIPRISCNTMYNIIEKKYQADYTVIDCRFDYEYDGGHIKDAVNINDVETLKRKMPSLKNQILIFYCEFSSVRAPKMAQYLRNYDRFSSAYPTLNFPEIYVLEGGYNKFYEMFRTCCDPQNYIKMGKNK